MHSYFTRGSTNLFIDKISNLYKVSRSVISSFIKYLSYYELSIAVFR